MASDGDAEGHDVGTRGGSTAGDGGTEGNDIGSCPVGNDGAREEAPVGSDAQGDDVLATDLAASGGGEPGGGVGARG